MPQIDKKHILLEYRIPPQGVPNKMVSECVNAGWTGECDGDISHRELPYCVVEDIIGFAETQWGWAVVWRCKSCGKVQWFHLRENDDHGLDYVRMYHEYKTTGKYSF